MFTPEEELENYQEESVLLIEEAELEEVEQEETEEDDIVPDAATKPADEAVMADDLLEFLDQEEKELSSIVLDVRTTPFFTVERL